MTILILIYTYMTLFAHVLRFKLIYTSGIFFVTNKRCLQKQRELQKRKRTAKQSKILQKPRIHRKVVGKAGEQSRSSKTAGISAKVTEW